MADDITTMLRDAAAGPKDTPDFDRLAVRGRRQHLLARSGAALAVALVLVAGSIAVWPGMLPSRMPVIGDRPTTPTGAGQVELPAGWQWVEVGRARFGVPGDWEIVSTTEHASAHCTLYHSTPPGVLTGPPPSPIPCPAPNFRNPGQGIRATTLADSPHVKPPDDARDVSVDGWPALRWPETGATEVGSQGDPELIEATFTVYLVEGLDLYLKIRTDTAPDLAEQILATVAERHLNLVRRSLPGGVEVEVPDSWEIRHAQVECFSWGTSPALSWGVGYPSGMVSCSPGLSSAPGVLVILDVIVQPDGDARPAGTGDWQAILDPDGRVREYFSPCHDLVVRTAGLSSELEDSVLASVTSRAECSKI